MKFSIRKHLALVPKWLPDSIIIFLSALISALSTIFKDFEFPIVINGYSMNIKDSHLSIISLLLLVTTLILKIVIEKSARKIIKDGERIIQKLTSQLEQSQEVENNFQDLAREFINSIISDICGTLRFFNSKKHCHRISKYLPKPKNGRVLLVPLARESNQAKYKNIRIGRDYSTKEGFLGKTWNEGTCFESFQGKSDLLDAYKKWHSDVGVDFEVQGLRMKSLFYFGKRLDNPNNFNKPTAVIMIESTNKQAFQMKDLEAILPTTVPLIRVLHKYGEKLSTLETAREMGL